VASVTLRRLAKRYGPHSRPALEEVSLEVGDGEFFVLVGPSGCGKTTLLRCIAGLEEPSAGEILLDGRDVTRLEPAARDVAMVFQTYALYPHLTVRRNIAFGLEVRRVPTAEIARRVQQAADRLGLGTLLDRGPGELSGGERQRVALGRALVREPRVFLLDEPLSQLEPNLRSELRSELLELHRALHTTVVYVTHDQVEAMTMGQRIAVLEGGRVRQVGKIYLGVRPEHVSLVAPDQGIGAADVRGVEPLGPDTIVRLDAGGQPIAARLHGIPDLRPGARVGVKLDRRQLHLFNATGARLR